MAYTNSLRSADRIIFGWQKRASQGKLIGNFALRVNELLESTRLEFLSSTIGTSVVRERNERLNQVSKHIVDQCEIIYRQQVSTLSSTLLRKFKKELLKNFNSYEDQSKVSEENNNTLRKIIFDFRASAASLEDEKLGFDSSIALNQLSSILEETLKEFPETSAAKLSELKKIENQARRPIKKKRNSRAVNIALSLVGMFRPPGRGSLQGFAGYSTSLLGMPFDLLFGVQNDGDSPEVCFNQSIEGCMIYY